MSKPLNAIRVAIIIIMLLPAMLVGCSRSSTPITSRIDLTQTDIPDMDLDVYVFVKQAQPTIIPGSFGGASTDLAVESLALWGVAKGDGMALGGALIFSNANDAARAGAFVQQQTSLVWTSLADRTLYFAGATGPSADTFKPVITGKKYNNKGVQSEVALLPDSDPARLAGVAVLTPSRQFIQFIQKSVGGSYAETINRVYTWGRLQSIVAGIYSPQQIDISQTALAVMMGTIGQSNLGALASVKLGVPGFLVGIAAGSVLQSAGFTQVNLNGTAAYRGSFVVAGRSVPVFLRVEGSNIFVSAATNETYGQTLITKIKG